LCHNPCLLIRCAGVSPIPHTADTNWHVIHQNTILRQPPWNTASIDDWSEGRP
jgi:hypothetical protein